MIIKIVQTNQNAATVRALHADQSSALTNQNAATRVLHDQDFCKSGILDLYLMSRFMEFDWTAFVVVQSFLTVTFWNQSLSNHILPFQSKIALWQGWTTVRLSNCFVSCFASKPYHSPAIFCRQDPSRRSDFFLSSYSRPRMLRETSLYCARVTMPLACIYKLSVMPESSMCSVFATALWTVRSYLVDSFLKIWDENVRANFCFLQNWSQDIDCERPRAQRLETNFG